MDCSDPPRAQHAILTGNNLGASFLSSGFYEKAYQQLKKTLRETKDMLLAEAGNQSLPVLCDGESHVPSFSGNNKQNPIPSAYSRRGALNETSSSHTYGNEHFEDVSSLDFKTVYSSRIAPFLVWSRPFSSISCPKHQEVTVSPTDTSIPDKKCYLHPISSIMSAQIVFNMALACHLLAIKTEDTGRTSSRAAALFRKARSLYESSIPLLMAAPEPSLSILTRTSYHMILANNLAHCHGQLGEEQRSEQSLKYVFRHIAHVLHDGGRSTDGVTEAAPAVLPIRNISEQLFPNVGHLLVAGPSRKTRVRVAAAA
jgi:hypothetical protein